MVVNTIEMRPLLNVKSKEYDNYTALIVEKEDDIIAEKPDEFEEEYEDFLNSVKTTYFFTEWMEEKDDEYLFCSQGQ